MLTNMTKELLKFRTRKALLKTTSVASRFSSAKNDILIGKEPLVVALVSCHQGQRKAGVEHAWLPFLPTAPFLRFSTLVDFRNSSHFDDLLEGCLTLSHQISASLLKCHQHHGHEVPLLTLGGDHSISIGSVRGTRSRDLQTRLVWVDAHTDIHTPSSSTSGNYHGMPVAFLMGLVDWFGMMEPPIQPHEIAYIGIRSVDPPEEDRLVQLESSGSLIYRADKVQAVGIDNVLADIDSKWGNGNASQEGSRFDFPVHLSLDIDSIDPTWAPATGTPVINGLSPIEVDTCHLDLVEVNPYLASPEGAVTTLRTASYVLETWLKSSPSLLMNRCVHDKES